MLIDGLRKRGHPVHLFTAQFNEKSRWSGFLAERQTPVTRPGFWFLNRYHLPHRVCAGSSAGPPSACGRRWSWPWTTIPCAARRLRLWKRDDIPFVVHDPSEASPACPHYEPLWFQVCHRITGLSVHGERQAASARDYYKLARPIRAIWPGCMRPTERVEEPRVEMPLALGCSAAGKHQGGRLRGCGSASGPERRSVCRAASLRGGAVAAHACGADCQPRHRRPGPAAWGIPLAGPRPLGVGNRRRSDAVHL